MNFAEQALIFSAAGEQLLGIAPIPEMPGDCGVFIVVGGPQYCVGSHRQLPLLACRLATKGYPSMRFDYRRMGDGSGAIRDFDDVADARND